MYGFDPQFITTMLNSISIMNFHDDQSYIENMTMLPVLNALNTQKYDNIVGYILKHTFFSMMNTKMLSAMNALNAFYYL